MVQAITRDYLLSKYLVAIDECDALNGGTLTALETAGYWLYEASFNPRRAFNDMLKQNDVLLSEDDFLAEVNNYLLEVGV